MSIASISVCACSGTSGTATSQTGAGATTTGSSSTHSGAATTSGAGGAESSTSGAGASSSTSGTGGSSGCSPDPLHTGLTAMQTGVSVDAFDCQVLTYTAKFNEPDAMIFKAMMYVESRFDDTAVACPNDPCGTPSGWTTAESGCFGLLQVVPACGATPGTPAGIGLLPNGQPNLTTDTTASGWAGSIFNPSNNVELGIAGVANNRAQVMKQIPGCTVDQYTMMAVGNFNSYGSATSCTDHNAAYDGPVVMAYQQYATAAGYTAHPYAP